jgi:hypothetical protein
VRWLAERVAGRVAAVVGLGALLSGCALSDGVPWGEARLSLAARFAPEPGRLDDAGRLVTADDYAVRVDRLALVFDGVGLAMGAGGAAAAFDPASPPEGYSLCHNGHCHADDGRLVPYEEIAAELAGGGEGGFTVSQAAEGGEVALGAAVSAVPLEPCGLACDLPRGRVIQASALVDRVVLVGRVFDRRTGANARLPEAGVAVEVELAVETNLTVAASAAVDDHHPVPVVVALELRVPDALLDGADFGAWLGADPPADWASELADVVAENLSESGALAATVSRRGGASSVE